MKGDFTRATFARERHYAGVRLQQGRVLLDADWNEQADIAACREETGTLDVVGPCGGPLHDAAFGVVTALADVTDAAESALLAALLPAGLAPGDFLLTPGRFYVDGILCENEHYVPYTLQADLPGLSPLDVSVAGTRYLLYLDVWRRHVTALDDGRLREAALGGPDTATRLRTVWQVRALGAGTGEFHCPDTLSAYDEATAPSTGTLRAQAMREATSDSPCVVPPSAGYTGLENQLYRIEIHDSGQGFDVAAAASTAITAFPAADEVEYTDGDWDVGDAVEIYRSEAPDDPMNGELAVVTAKETVDGKKRLTLGRTVAAIAAEEKPRLRKVEATFKWSRDNGIVVSAINAVSGTDVTVESLGVDSVLDFEPGHWVEITDRARELDGRSGVLAQVAAVVPASRIVRLHAAPSWPGDLASVDAARGLTLRRWDGVGAVKYGAGAPAWINLESGVQVAFDGGIHHAGDYWQVPARTASADARSGRVEWPVDSAGNSAARRAAGIAHHYCRLAVLTVAADGTLDWHDCRDLFPPLTEMTRLFHVGGDGQEAMPGDVIRKPLEAGVFNGETPVQGAWVRFEAEFGGKLGPTEVAAATGAATLDVATSSAGVAACWWLPDPSTTHPSQQVTATLLDDASADTAQVIHFDGSLSFADEVWYDPGDCGALAGQGTVQRAVSRLAALASLYLVDGGDQIVKPGEAIKTLKVRAASACGAITDAQAHVHFEVTAGNGTLTGGATQADVPLSVADGTASCDWTLDATTHDQEVVATLVGNGVPTAEPTTVRFTAALSAAVHVAYDPAHCPGMSAAHVGDVQAAIDYLCGRGAGGCWLAVEPGKGNLAHAIKAALERKAGCLCLLPGEHLLEGGLEIGADGAVLRIVGCGPASVIRVAKGPLAVERLVHFELRDLDVRSAEVDAPLSISRCRDVVVSGCHMEVSDTATTLLQIAACGSLRIVASQLRAFTDLTRAAPDATGRLEIAPLPQLATADEIRSYLVQAAGAIAHARKAARTSLARAIERFAESESRSAELARRMRALAEALGTTLPEVAVLGRALAGRAIVLMDALAVTRIEDCVVAGEIRLYGNDGDFPARLRERLLTARAVDVEPGRGELMLRGNHVLRLALDAKAKELFQTTEDGQVQVRDVHARAVISENRFALPDGFLVARSAGVVTNDFASEGGVLDILADTAVAVGNIGPAKAEIRMKAARADKAANVVTVSP